MTAPSKLCRSLPLQENEHVAAEKSQALPMLTAALLTEYPARMQQEGEFAAITAFDEWLQTLPQ